MEWVETTAKTIDEAKEKALDQLGVADDDAEFEILEEPKAGLFGLIRGEARVRGRIRPTEARPKVERRRGRRSDTSSASTPSDAGTTATATDERGDDTGEDTGDTSGGAATRSGNGRGRRGGNSGSTGDGAQRSRARRDDRTDRDDRDDRPPVEPAAVGAAAVSFMEGLVEAFGLQATVELDIDGTELDVRVEGDDLGLLIGPGGRTLLAVQDLARVAAQRKLGDHETRLRIDVAGYRERRRTALERFARTVAEQVIDTSSPRSLEPMPSADRKVIHDVLVEIDGVTSHSEGDDPYRRVVVTPA
ncbi:MAG: KH domain-containing protein [Ilumatobacter sp.]|nr:MAG: KH domain-containing protein [Ilumatobacter sp.]